MKGFCLEVSGPYACFTRPEMKVERVSYDVSTLSPRACQSSSPKGWPDLAATIR